MQLRAARDRAAHPAVGAALGVGAAEIGRAFDVAQVFRQGDGDRQIGRLFRRALTLVEARRRLHDEIRLALRAVKRIGLLLLPIDALRLDHGDAGLIADDEHRVAPVTPVGVVVMQHMRLVVGRRNILRAPRHARAVVRGDIAAVEPFRLVLGVGEMVLRQERGAVVRIQIGLTARGGIGAVLARRDGRCDLRNRAVRAHGLRPDAGGRDDAVGLVDRRRVAHLRAHKGAVVGLLIDQQTRPLDIQQHGHAGLVVALQRLEGVVIHKLILGRVAHLVKAVPIRAVRLCAVFDRQSRLGFVRAVDEVLLIISGQLIGRRREAQEVRCEPELVVFLIAGVVGEARAQIKLRARNRNVVAVALILNIHAPTGRIFETCVKHTVLQDAGQRQLQTGLVDVVVPNLLLVVRACGVGECRVVDGRKLQIACRGGRIERALSVFLNDLILCAVGRVVAQLVEGLHDPELTRREHADALVRAVCADLGAAVAVHRRHLVHVDLIAADRDENLARRRAVLVPQLNGRPCAAVEAAPIFSAGVIGRAVDHSVVIVIEHATVAVCRAIRLDHIAVRAVEQWHIAGRVGRDLLPGRVVRTGIRCVDPIFAAQPELEGDRLAVRDLDALEPLVGLIVIQLEADREIHQAAGDELVARDPIVRRDLAARRIAGVKVKAVLVARVALDLDVIARRGADRHALGACRRLIGLGRPVDVRADRRLDLRAVRHALHANGQVLTKRTRHNGLPSVLQMLIGHKRLRIAVVNDPVGIFPAVLHPCHSRRVKLGLRTCQRERECHADIRFAVRFCGVCRSDIHSELVIHRVKAADDLILCAAVVTDLVICVPRSRAVRDLAELDTGHFRLAAVRDQCSRCRQRKAGAQA